MDSLVLGDIELLGGGVVSTNPMCPGVMFRLLPGYDPGAPQPTADFVASLLLDGERPFGRRASNRTVKLPVWIYAPDRDTLAGAREHIESIVDQDMWPITWARDRGGQPPLPLIIDCFRAQPTQVTADLIREKQFMMQVTLTIPALPYGRSNIQEQLRFAAPVPSGPPPPPPPVLLDDYSTITSPLCVQANKCVVGPHSVCWDPDDNRCGDPGGQTTMFEYSSVFLNNLDLTGMTSVGMWLGFGSRYYWCLDYHGQHSGVRVTLDLTDTAGNKLSFSRNHLRMPVTPSPQAPCFSQVSMRIPTNSTVFDYASVASYTLTVSNRHAIAHTLQWVTLYVDALTAYPDTQTVTPVTHGSVYTLYGLKGTARAAMTASFIQPPAAGTPTTITAAGVGNYTVPANTAWLKVEGVGTGGPGATRTSAGMGGGGSGAEYAREDVFPVVVGEIIPYSISPAATPGNDGGSTQFGPGSLGPLALTAHGGKAAPANGTTGGLPGTGSANSVHHDGGAGRTTAGTFGGGGGSSGGTAAPGNTPLGTGAASWTAPGTTPWVSPLTGMIYAEAWGSGGGGATGYSSGNGAAGGGGEYAAGWIHVTQGNSYNIVVASPGAGGSGVQKNGSDGSNSSFTGDAGANITAHGGTHGSPGQSGGSGLGGSGSNASVHHNGGLGGWSNPYSGGGGSSGSPSGQGNDGDGYGNPGGVPTDGGGGGAGSGATGNPGVNGQTPGGGGGGTYSSTVAGNGGAGKVRLTYAGGGLADQYGAPAVTGGGAGGAGGAAANSTGAAGSQPGGGGGGANSSGATEAGGNGGVGKLIITPYASQPWKTLIAHRPPRGSSKLYQPLVSVGAGADVPDGTHWYTLPQPVAGVNALFSGTYSIYLINYSWNGSGSRTVTVTVRQTEYAGGPSYQVATVPVTFTPSQVTNGIFTAGVLTLPVKRIPAENKTASFQVAVTDTNTSDRWMDCLLLDTMGQTAVINEATAGYVTYLIDAPDANTQYGNILGTQTDRTAAVAVFDAVTSLSGGPLTVEPADGDNILFAYSADGLAPAIGVSYFPAWYWDRTS